MRVLVIEDEPKLGALLQRGLRAKGHPADLVREGIPTVSTAEHARHVIDIIESAYRSADTGAAQALRTKFVPFS